MSRSAALVGLVGLVGCQPVLYDLFGGASAAVDATGDLTEHGSETMSPTTGPEGTGDPTLTGGPPPGWCGDGEPGGEETDVDCGGPSCPPCPPGSKCEVPKDCAGGLCMAGVCAPAPQCEGPEDCAPEPCRKASCAPGTKQCVYADLDGIGCDDGDLCTDDDACAGGECTGIVRDCGGLDDLCQIGFCNPNTGNCGIELLDGQPCEDGQMCTFDESCVNGACTGKMLPPLFFDDFSQPGGWISDGAWQIGPAAPSNCADNGFDDPADDHSAGPDGRLAGEAIGGCLPDKAEPMERCLTSPPINTMVPGPVWLTYWSQLSAVQAPGAARVHVWTGISWQPIFDTNGQAFDEAGWQFHTIDVTMHKSFAMAVRFCHHVPEMGLPIVSGWSVDDVYLGAHGCEPP